MISELGSFIFSIIQSAWSMLNSSSSWMVFSFAVAGVLHEFLKPEKIQKTAIGSKRISGVFWTTLSGMFIPICSCGTIPLGISMYYSGAYLGPTLAFMTSTPMINPLAVILAWGLLGKEITIIYIITGFVAPMIIGIVANHFAGNELHIGLRNKNNEEAEGTISLETDEEEEPAMIQLEFEEPSVWEKLKSGLRWSFTELSVTISKYTVSGMLVASGAAPGVAITFLMAGAGTNIPELLTISKTIGKRAMFMYFPMVVVISNLVGYLTNRLLMPGFNPVLDFDRTSHTIQQANKLIIALPDWGEWICSGILVAYAAYALFTAIRSKMKKA